MAYVPEHAPLVVLMFLGTGFVLGLVGLAFVFLLGTKKKVHARRVFILGAGIAAIYLGLILIASSRSEEKMLAAGEWKYFCEIDCHVAYAVESVATSKTLGEGKGRAEAVGTFYVVKLKTWFDPETTSATRGNGLLFPNPRLVHVVDESGRRHETSLEGTKAVGSAGIPLTQPLRPGDVYETTLVFDVPADARNPRLFVGDMIPITTFLIGHENSPWHKKSYFRLTGVSISAM